jgi:hypothetical protein
LKNHQTPPVFSERRVGNEVDFYGFEKHIQKMDNTDGDWGAALNQFAVIYGEDRVPL